MGLMARDGGAGESRFENAPAGAYVARCYRVIDLGTQTFAVKGETKRAHQVLISWELGKAMADGKPYTIGEKYTLSLNEKAKLSAVLEGWRGRKFTEVERAGFDLKNILGKVCFLNVVHVQRGEKTYANVASVMPLPDGVPSPTPVNEVVFYSIEEHHTNIPDGLGNHYTEMIKKSPEYQRSSSAAAQSSEVMGDLDDEIPF